MTADPYRRGDMATDVSTALDYAHRHRLDSGGVRWDALEEVARTIFCWAYGHPAQPKRFLSRFQERPWRCFRCGTWWVTRHETDYPTYPEGTWRWHRVYQDERTDS